MFAVVVVVAALAATPAPLKLATGTFTYVGIKDELRVFVPEHVATRMRSADIAVVTPAEVQALLGRERQRQLMGCEASTGCDAELIGALGVDGLVMGELAAVGDVLQLNLKVVSESGQNLATWSNRVQGANHLLDALDEGAAAIAEQVLIATGRRKAPPPPTASARRWFWVPAAAGVLIGAAGGTFLGLSKRDHDLLVTAGSPRLDATRATNLAREGDLFQTLGFVGVGVGSAAVLAGLGLLVFGGPATPPLTPSVSVGAQGASFSLQGVFP